MCASPLDELIDKLGGPDKVAEMTGRKGRMVRRGPHSKPVYEQRASQAAQGALENLNVKEVSDCSATILFEYVVVNWLLMCMVAGGGMYLAPSVCFILGVVWHFVGVVWHIFGVVWHILGDQSHSRCGPSNSGCGPAHSGCGLAHFGCGLIHSECGLTHSLHDLT